MVENSLSLLTFSVMLCGESFVFSGRVAKYDARSAAEDESIGCQKSRQLVNTAVMMKDANNGFSGL
jgi:hypothetical protein